MASVPAPTGTPISSILIGGVRCACWGPVTTDKIFTLNSHPVLDGNSSFERLDAFIFLSEMVSQ